jgi:hypothetical protein
MAVELQAKRLFHRAALMARFGEAADRDVARACLIAGGRPL